jgi:hypothetical protein
MRFCSDAAGDETGSTWPNPDDGWLGRDWARLRLSRRSRTELTPARCSGSQNVRDGYLVHERPSAESRTAGEQLASMPWCASPVPSCWLHATDTPDGGTPTRGRNIEKSPRNLPGTYIPRNADGAS